jgi:hypothetical protein
MRFLLTLLAVTACAGVPARAAEDATTPAPNPQEGDGSTERRMQVARAAAKAEEGRASLLRYRANQTNPEPLVAAALAYAEAHKLYEALGDNESVCDVQANLFWCKKQMNLEAVQAYLKEAKGEAKEGLARVDQVAERKVEASEAEAYVSRAEQYAKDHADDPLAVSIRWFEVAERFVGSPAAITAQKASLAAQETWQKREREHAEAARATRFTKSAAVVSGQRVDVPDAATQKAAQADIKKLWSKDYAKANTVAGKSRLARKLAEEAAKSKDDAATYFVMLSESIRLAAESDDYERLLDGCDQVAAAFNGRDALADKKAVLNKLKSKPVAAAILILLDQPEDPAANTTAGRYFCLSLERWDDGRPMLARGSDADLKKLAEMELANPSTPSEKAATGDGWYTLGKKAIKADEKNALLARALLWYQGAITELTGVSKDRIQTRLAEIDKALPLDLERVNWDNLTPSQWEKIPKAATIAVLARTDRTDPSLILKAGERIRIVPHPSDTWSNDTYWEKGITTNWRGAERDSGPKRTTYYDNDLRNSNLPFGCLVWWLDNENNRPEVPGVVTGPGRVYLACNRAVGLFGNGNYTGQIRVKLLPVKDD